jgi:hypothetical protein
LKVKKSMWKGLFYRGTWEASQHQQNTSHVIF